MRAAIYTRVSTQEQADHNLSLESQEKATRSYCDAQGWSVVDVYVDGGYSGMTEQRPGLERLMRDVEAGLLDAVVVWRQDRFYRKQRHLHNGIGILEAHKVRFVSTSQGLDSGTQSGRLLIGFLGTLAEAEWDALRERTMTGKRMAAEKGRYVGGPLAFGYTRDKESKVLLLDEQEAYWVRRIFALVAEGKTAREVARWLNEQGVRPKYAHWGKTEMWHGRRISYLIHNTAYKGSFVYGRHQRQSGMPSVTVPCPAIVSEDLWEQAQVRMAANLKYATRNSKRIYLLTGLVRCGRCGMAYNGSFYKTADGSEVRYYRCSRKYPYESCLGANIPAAFLEKLVWDDVRDFLERPDNVITVLEGLSDAGPDRTEERARADRRLRELEEQERRLAGLYVSGTLSQGALDAVASQIASDRRTMLRIRDEIDRERDDNDAEKRRRLVVWEQLEQLRTVLDEPTPEQTQEAIRSLVSGVTVDLTEDGHKKVSVRYVFGEPTGVIVSQSP